MLVKMNRFFLTDDPIGDIRPALEVVGGFLLNVLESNGCWGWLNPSLMILCCTCCCDVVGCGLGLDTTEQSIGLELFTNGHGELMCISEML